MTGKDISFFDRGDGVALAYRYGAGRGPCLVFLPGFMSDMTGEKATALVAMAARAGFAHLRLDYSGHGASGGAFEDGTISRWRDDVLCLIDHIVEGDVVVVGSSMGGWIALLVALAQLDRVKALVGIAAAPDFTKSLLWERMSEEARAAILEHGEWRTPSAYGGDQVFTKALIEDGERNLLLERAIDLKIPVHLVQGMEDPDVPWTTALQISEKLAGGDVRITLVKDGDHRLSRAKDIELLCQIVGRVLRENGGEAFAEAGVE